MASDNTTNWSCKMNTARIFATTAAIAWALLTLAAAPTTAMGMDGAPAPTDDRQPGAGEPAGAKEFPAPGGAYSWHVIPAAAFAPRGDDIDPEYQFVFAVGAIQGSGDRFGGCVRAPVLLPGDARVFFFGAYVIDNDSPDEINIRLERVNNTTGVRERITSVSTLGASPEIQYIFENDLIANNILEYPTYSYWVHTCLSRSTHKLFAVFIEYSAEGIFDDGFGSGNTTRWDTTMP